MGLEPASMDSSSDIDIRQSPVLETLMKMHVAVDLGDQVVIPDYRNRVNGGLADVFLGKMGEKNVSSGFREPSLG
jgi:hypothetical protein